MASDAELLEAIERLNNKLETVHDAIRKRTFVLILIAVALIISVVVGGFTAWSLRQDANERDEAARDARIASCVQYNVQSVLAREGTVEVAVAALEALAPDPDHLTPEQLVRREGVVQRAEKAAEKAFPFRDCSPEGIKKYLSDPPPDPALDK